MSKTITLSLEEYKALELNADKFLQLKNIKEETRRLEKIQESTKEKLNAERDSLAREIVYMNKEAEKLREHLASEQANMPVVLLDHHRYNYMRITDLVPFNRLKPYYENEAGFIRFVEDVKAKALKSKDSIVSHVIVFIFAFFVGALLI